MKSAGEFDLIEFIRTQQSVVRPDVLLGIGTCAEEVLRARKILQHAERPPETDRPGTDSPAL